MGDQVGFGFLFYVVPWGSKGCKYKTYYDQAERILVGQQLSHKQLHRVKCVQQH